mmetsp:Transcript_2887/g.5485  ORF Transcript_2887/g.5485 Transcript_2887/m.5485 type:complete len:335 (-) Transcript_2887:227-1231(-)|eukprot:CAMPEP_0203749332 /NCGR_PEP_ID=MMETSP0098-20131031/3934_1 /ASSEMBLY_ACC=CAM_ASM_000208 /TAXON_ID=96639 /ORGANISM=" , Strain NY0313808BC1" /LENGTH=334 /DNA_ID=CAMNT_0050638369 /DNA_START=1336 /DNA_END=2340 /DNA_ORIENTATION=+
MKTVCAFVAAAAVAGSVEGHWSRSKFALCDVEQTCSVWADPHISTFGGIVTTIHQSKFDLYRTTGYRTSCTTATDTSIQTVNIEAGPQSAKHTVADCKKFHQILYNETVKTSKGEIIQTIVQCHSAPNATGRAPMYLNIHVKRNAKDISKKTQGSGMCVKLTGATTDSTGLESPFEESSSGECRRTCQATGDPHVLNFFNQHYRVRNAGGPISLYDVDFKKNEFKVDANLDKYGHMESVTVVSPQGKKIITKDDFGCKSKADAKAGVSKEYKYELGQDSAVLKLVCDYPRKSKYGHETFMNVYLTKHDDLEGKGIPAFRLLERVRNSKGYCISK